MDTTVLWLLKNLKAKPMNIIVCIKQVPESATTEVDPALYTINRNKSTAVINPFDLHAIECALSIKDKFPETKITALCMGPQTAQEALKEAISLGVDDALLICDKSLIGSDSLITATVLSAAIKTTNFDIIICGQQSIDGDTAQVGPEIASLLKISQCTKTIKINHITKKNITITRRLKDTEETINFKYPLLITVGREINNPRLMKFKDRQKAKNAIIKTININELGLNPSQTGIKGSPTKVIKIYPCKKNHQTTFLSGTIEQQSKKTAMFLKDFI